MTPPIHPSAEALAAAHAIYGMIFSFKTEPQDVARLIDSATNLPKLLKLLDSLSGDDAERLAHDMDHHQKDHSRWYRNVKKARALLAKHQPNET